MASVPPRRSNPLGDTRAEADNAMLSRAFFETPDYRTIVASGDRPLVVGRRGAGKSALAGRLGQFWGQSSRNVVVRFAPHEDEMIGLRPVFRHFGDKYSHVRAGAKIAWTYAFLTELSTQVLAHWSVREAKLQGALATLQAHVMKWKEASSTSLAARLKATLKRAIDPTADVETRIGDLVERLGSTELEAALSSVLEESNARAFILVDRLDEGFDPDELGIAIVSGVAMASVRLSSAVPNTRIVCFLRDNMFRALQRDPDYARNLEGQALRLHWDERHLLAFAAARMRVAFGLSEEQDLKVWNACTAGDLQHMDGFRQCLRLTLYRPRDLLVLLNEAYLDAGKADSGRIAGEIIAKSARTISNTRLDDLKKEYASNFPGLAPMLDAFSGGSAKLTVSATERLIADAMAAPGLAPASLQHFELLGSKEVIRQLYSIGFVGLLDRATEQYAFCHDGSLPADVLHVDSQLMVHPCYWIALNLASEGDLRSATAEVHDDYMEVRSETPKLREKVVGTLISRLGQLQTGNADAAHFEEWCATAIKILFAGRLDNVEMKPNSNHVQRRDIVGTIIADRGAWRRIREDFGVRQVVFEVKNYEELGPAEFRQMLSYLLGPYGRLGFIITRAPVEEPTRDGLLRWVREIYNGHNKLIVPTSVKFYSRLLHKIRSPKRHDEPEQALNALLDSYERSYLNEGGGPRRGKRSK